MKRTALIITATAAILTLSACGNAGNAAETTTAPETEALTSQVTVSFAASDEPVEGEVVVEGSGEVPAGDPIATLPVDIENAPDGDITVNVADITQIHLPNQTIPESGDGLFPGEYKDESYWDAVTGADENETVSVFIVSVDADTTDEMMQEVIDKYGLTVIYDYENFNMYAISVPEPLDKAAAGQFMTELTDNYDFILMVEPDGVMYLDDSEGK